MKSDYFSNRIGRILLVLSFLVGVGLASTSAVQAQYRRDQDPYYGRDRDQDRQYRRDDRNGRYGNVAANQGYQDGLYTGSNDAQRGQSYNPQRSHFYRNGHGNNGSYGNNGRYGNQQAYRDGFLRGYDEGFRRYGGYNRGRNNRNNGRWPFPW